MGMKNTLQGRLATSKISSLFELTVNVSRFKGELC